MTIQECKNHERIYKKLVEKFQPTSTWGLHTGSIWFCKKDGD